MSDFRIPTVNAVAAFERCPDCGSSRSQAVADLAKCLDCGASWVAGSGQPAAPGPIELLEDAVSDLWANINAPEINQLLPETIALCKELHQRRDHG